MTVCSFCAFSFSEEEGMKSCGRCASFGGCRNVKCPRCGYEMPQTAGLIKLLGKFGRKRAETAR
jgi:rubredoxin